MKLFLKAVTFAFQIIGSLCIFRKSACRCLLMQFVELAFSDFPKLLFTCKNVHGKFFKVCKVLLIHFIQHGRIFHQTHLVLLQSFRNLRHISLGLCVTVFQSFHLRCLFFEKAEKSLFLCGIKILQFSYHICKKLSCLPKILCLHIYQRCIRKICHLLLSAGSVLQDLVCIFNIDLCCKIFYDFLFLWR